MRPSARLVDEPVRALDRSRVRAGLRAGLFGRGAAPARVGRFELRHKLGEGASGVAYAAYDPELGRDVAVKLLVHGLRDREAAFAEARTLAQLNHPNVLAAYDIGEFEGVPYVVSELATGGNLREFLAAGADVDTRRRVLRDILAGVAEAHERGIVHRDLKPENIFVGGGRARVGDFGLAASTARGGTSPVGTPAYMAPEVQRGLRNDPRSDQFSLGIIAFELLFGRHPFDGAPAVPDERPRLDGFPPAERAVAAVVLQALAAHDADRHPSVRSFAEALERAFAASARVPRWIRGVRGVTVAGGLVLVSAAVALFVARRSAGPDAQTRVVEARLRTQAAESALIAEMGALGRAMRFTECADILERRANTEALDRFWVSCAEHATLAHLQRACRAVGSRHPALVFAECDGPALEARALEAAGRPADCVARLAREAPTLQRVMALGACRGAAPDAMSPQAFCVYNARYAGSDPSACLGVAEP